MTHTESPLSRWMLKLENARPLDLAVTMVQPAIKAVASNGTVRAGLQGRWLGHAAHPVVVMMPIGLWTSAAVLHSTGLPEAQRPAHLLTGMGIMGALPATLTGLSEVAAGADERIKRVAVVHATLNTVALGLEVGSWLSGKAGNRAMAKFDSFAALAVTMVSGYLGGHMSIARKYGTRDEAFDAQ